MYSAIALLMNKNTKKVIYHPLYNIPSNIIYTIHCTNYILMKKIYNAKRMLNDFVLRSIISEYYAPTFKEFPSIPSVLSDMF